MKKWRIHIFPLLAVLALIVLALASLGGCQKKSSTQAQADVAQKNADQAAEQSSEASKRENAQAEKTARKPLGDPDKYPIAPADRPYQDIAPQGKQAWFLVETSYYVIRQKYADANKLLQSSDAKEKEKGGQLKSALTPEIDRSIFGVNDKVDQLFKDAIAAQPDNPLNMAAYAYYLKARKRFNKDGSTRDTEQEALEQMDQAIALWPDETSFYLLKAHIMSAPHMCNDWFRSRAMEELAIAQRLPELLELLDNAEQYDPQNHYINYYRALLLTQYTPPENFAEVRGKVLREIRAGNAKPYGYFFFPPPLMPRYAMAQAVKLFGTEKEAKYVDHWTFFGHYEAQNVDQLVDSLLGSVKPGAPAPKTPLPVLQWPKDKEDAGALMYMLWQIGRTQPYDRSLFSLQLKVLLAAQAQVEPGSSEALKLAEAARFLNEQYRSAANEMYKLKLIEDPSRVDIRGINELEFKRSRQDNLKRMLQAREAAYLKRAGEILGLKFNLPQDPSEW